MIRWKYISGVAIIALSVVVGCLSPLVANAAPGYDDDYQNVSSISTGASNFYNLSCDAVDISTTWSEYIVDKNTWYNPNETSGWNTDAKASFQTALQNGRWAVSTSVEWGSGGWFRSIRVAWTEDNSAQINWVGNGLVAMSGSAVHSLFIGCRKIVHGNGGSEPIAWAYNVGGSMYISNDKPFVEVPANESEVGGVANLFANVDENNVHYPQGYQGPLIPGTYTPMEAVYPEVEYTVENKKITLRYTGNIGGCSIVWGYQGEQNGDPLITHQQRSDEPYIINADEYKKYSILVDLKYYGPPAICKPFPENSDVKVLTFTLDITGQDFSGNTGHMDCSTQGDHTSCLTPSPYEDCSTFGADLIGGLGCVMRNFGTALRSLLIALFVPTSGFLKDYFDDFKTSITAKLGFLVWPLTWAIDFVNAFFDGLSGTNNICGWSFGNVFNSDFKLNFCSLEQNFPSAFNTARYMIQAFTVFVLISGFYEHYRRTIKT